MKPWTEFSFILKPSSLEGIGVFAIHDLAAGTQLFHGKFSFRELNPKDIPLEFTKYCIFLSDEACLCPEHFDQMHIGWFINHSDNPNVGKHPTLGFATLRNINSGEEITMNYNEYNEPEHLKEAYYSKS